MSSEIIFRLSDRTDTFVFDEREALFSEEQQKLLELNELAAYFIHRLKDGVTFMQLADDLTDQGVRPEDAVEWVRRSLLDWSQNGFVVADASSVEALIPAKSLHQTIEIAGLTISIRYGSSDLHCALGGAFEHLEKQSTGVALAYTVIHDGEFVFVSKQGIPAAIVEEQQALPALKAFLFQDVIAQPDAMAAFHTASVVHEDRAVLLAGSPGVGKTTLTLALMAAGFGYAADDVTLLRRDGTVQGVPFSPTAKEGSWNLLEQIGFELSDIPVHRRLDDVYVRYISPHKSFCTDPLLLRTFIKLRREKDARASLVPMGKVEALATILEEGFAPSKRASIECMRVLTEILSNADCYELYFSDLSEAVSLMRGLVSDEPGTPH